MNLPILGEIVFWRMEGVKVLREDTIKLAKGVGIDIEVPEVTGAYSLRKALDMMVKSSEEDVIWRKENNIYYIAEVKVKDGIRTKSEGTVTVTESDTNFSMSIDGSDELRDKIREEYNKWSGCIDGTLMISSLVGFIESKLSGVRVRKGGGVYFVKIDRIEMLNKLEEWCKKIGGVTLHRIKLVDEGRTMDEIALLFAERVDEEIQEASQYVKKVLGEDLRRNRAGIESRLDNIDKMKSDLELYKKMLGSKATDIEKSLEEVRASIFMLKME